MYKCPTSLAFRRICFCLLFKMVQQKKSYEKAQEVSMAELVTRWLFV
jgi:hypothetical protein